jgi:hypothetical protein
MMKPFWCMTFDASWLVCYPERKYALSWAEGNAMVAPSDILVASTLARTTRAFQPPLKGTTAGYAFEQALYQDLLNVEHWHYATPPDQFDMGLPITTKTGVRYEHDGMVANSDSLYVIEAKYYDRALTREVVGIFVQKLLDTLLGSYDEIGQFAIKPVLVSGHGTIDLAAWYHAIAWGILLISPDRPTPFDLLSAIQHTNSATPAAQRLAADCENLASQLWRPFNRIVSRPSSDSWSFSLDARRIYGAEKTHQLLDQWSECVADAARMKVLRVPSHHTTLVTES